MRLSRAGIGLISGLLAACGGWEGPRTARTAPAHGETADVPCAAAPVEVSGAGAPRCRPAFASGVNVAWFDFARDVPRPDLCRFRELFTSVQASGGRVVRWWLHVNGQSTPAYDAKGFAEPIDAGVIEDVRRLLDLAHETGVMLVISLWSFDMLQPGPRLEQNRLLLTSDEHRQVYIDNVLEPLVGALRGHPALHAWEAFNEPEGMTDDIPGYQGWSRGARVGIASVQRTVNWFGAAVRELDPSARYTNGCWSFPACSSVGSFQNYYSDEALLREGGRAGGTLDYYQVHYYAHNGPDASPFLRPASHWQLDKPIVIGEFWAKDSDGVPRDGLFTHLHANGYAGAWAWQYANTDGENDYRWPSMQAGLETLRDTAPESATVVCDGAP